MQGCVLWMFALNVALLMKKMHATCASDIERLIRDVQAQNATAAELAMLQYSGSGINDVGNYALCSRTNGTSFCLAVIQR